MATRKTITRKKRGEESFTAFFITFPTVFGLNIFKSNAPSLLQEVLSPTAIVRAKRRTRLSVRSFNPGSRRVLCTLLIFSEIR